MLLLQGDKRSLQVQVTGACISSDRLQGEGSAWITLQLCSEYSAKFTFVTPTIVVCFSASVILSQFSDFCKNGRFNREKSFSWHTSSEVKVLMPTGPCDSPDRYQPISV